MGGFQRESLALKQTQAFCGAEGWNCQRRWNLDAAVWSAAFAGMLGPVNGGAVYVSHTVNRAALKTPDIVIYKDVLCMRIIMKLIKEEYYAPVVVVILGVILSTILYLSIISHNVSEVELLFHQESEERLHAIQQKFKQASNALISIKNLYLSSRFVERSDFGVFTRQLLEDHHVFHTYKWIPLVHSPLREQYEKQARQNIYGFQFVERLHPEMPITKKNLKPAETRGFYFPIYYITSSKDREYLLGYDYASDPKMAKRLAQARDSGNFRVSDKLLIQHGASGPEYGFLMVLPVYMKDMDGTEAKTMKKRRANLLGFVGGVFEISAFAEQALKLVTVDDLSFTIEDSALPVPDRLLYTHQVGLETAPVWWEQTVPTLQSRKKISVADKTWVVTFHSTPYFAQRSKNVTPVIIFVFGLCLTAFVAMYLWQLKNHATQPVTEHGQAWVEPQATLPNHVRARAIEPPAYQEPAPAGKQKNIMVIEDDVDFMGIYRALLEADGWHVTTTTTCKDAGLKLISESVPDLVVLDLGLPDCDGLEILDTIRKGNIRTHVVVVSGCGEIDKAISSVRAGAAEFIEKPIEPPAFLEILNKLHARPVIRKALEDRRATSS